MKIRSWLAFNNLSMPKKFIAIFIVLFSIPVFLITLITYNNYMVSIQSQTIAYINQISTGIMTNLDNKIKDMEDTTLMPYFIPDLQRSLQIEGVNLDKEKLVDFNIMLMNKNWKSINDIYIFDDYGNLFYNANDIFSRQYDIKEKFDEYKRLAYEANGSPVVMGLQKGIDGEGGTRYFITVVRCIKDVSTFKKIGIIVVDLDTTFLDPLMSNLNEKTKGNSIIIDENSVILYDSSKKQQSLIFTNSQVQDLLTQTNGNFRLKINNSDLMFIYQYLPHLKWTILVSIPTDVLFSEAVRTSRMVLIITIISLSFGSLFFVLFAYTFTKPLRSLANLMEKVQGGNLDVQFNVKYKDEVGLVATNFNSMLVRIKELVNEVTETKLREKQTELNALQSQINPHFIYNTLETIRMIAVIHKIQEISDTIIILGKLLRYSINQINELATVKDELQHLENYIFLQNKRFSNKFVLKTIIPDSLLEMKTIKLIFQPIVENSILHGLEKKREKGYITIISEQTNNHVTFTISDNGIGIEPEALDEINKQIQTYSIYSNSTKFIGLRNVNERIKLFFGDLYGISIESVVGSGTSVIVKLPNNK